MDRFILARLEAAGLTPSPVAPRLDWLRRVHFDLIGLPPTPDEVQAFLSDPRPDAHERVVDALLASPRHGERWAQHWLDVVRYADTHGFEVNTERPNAWPYRDYVIRAFNNDVPYDRFVRDQIAGDAHNEDAATGFLVTASVLLPGQIGADEPSKRLARQDALDEIVVNTGQTFLGLSIGCARCHDHKFDPVSQRDYFAMQGFFAGVEYGERELRTPESVALREKARVLKARMAEIDTALSKLEPLARPGSTPPRRTDPRLNEERFPAIQARFVRFTIHDANLHPTLGLIEPCLDELEVFAAGATPTNVALASNGAKVTASGSRTSEIHRLDHLIDGQYGNSHSWMSDEAGRGWVMIELPAATTLDRVAWSRDREGKFTDRLPTSFTLEAGMSTETMVRLAFVPPPRPEVNALRNTERFTPAKALRLRLTIRKTNSLEPCIDELEAFDTSGRNVALASAGARATSSGEIRVADRHDLMFLNDGRYGNSHSWMGNEPGKGWVVVEFPAESLLERVSWGRDREGEFSDRLATDYTIEVQDAAGTWRLVADSTDRQERLPRGEGRHHVLASTALLTPDEARRADSLGRERKQLQADISAAETGRMAFTGAFRKPDSIHLLNRGDPEQPKDEVSPEVPTALGRLQLRADTAEQERRLALASWITSPTNPLTARVMVNRIWQGHFGTGLVSTPSDFGISGARPSHPELLDWLAGEFLRKSWSIKAMHRLIVLSATYRQSARIEPAAQALDADVRLLWRYPSRRLEAEVMRDAMLAVAGRLDLKMYGAGFDLFDRRGGLTGFKPVDSFSGEGLRRMIYAHKVRRERDAVFGAFDCPDGGQSTASRRESTTPIQALNLFNSVFTLEQSTAMAARAAREAGGEVSRQVELVYRLAMARKPSPVELEESLPVVRDHGLATLCRALFNSNEFLFQP